ncbi:HYD1 signature containing ADP-ribosyltransferase family protein [Streptomyces sp. NPDC091278]|uniref:HYD1 signature containing ADP-ribosyltransferase family protein n=1 Tax=Streptomyces sp. NPDC091278 TaxID=3155301 RepID=UPI00344F75B0
MTTPSFPGGPSLTDLYDDAMVGIGVDINDEGYEDGGFLTDVIGIPFIGAVGALRGGARAAARSMCHSFLPGTEVLMADGTRKKIEDVEVGDTVVTTDVETGRNTEKEVLDTIRTEDDKDFTEITLATGENLSSIVATDTHPFWVPALREWVPAGSLKVGQWLRTSAGTLVQIAVLDHYTKRQRTHDLTIEDIHAYYVLAGATPVLVHNCNDEIPDVLHHYTNEAGHDGILASQELRPSTQAANPNDVKFGDGQYLTDVQPEAKRPGRLSAAFYRVPWLGRKVSHYISIDVRGLDVCKGRGGKGSSIF